ncbi:MAG: TIGR04563 family protein [Polyangia bacterium]
MSESPKEVRGAVPAASSTKKKVTLYFNAPMLAETQKEAIRQDRSISWIIQAAWRRARDEIRRLPAVGGRPDDETPDT